MDEQDLLALRERIRAVCVHDQAQWDATWKEVLGDLSNSRRGLIPPDLLFDVLEANSVTLSRSEARLLLHQFQEPNGAVAATRFIRWMALNAPTDHVDPDLLFPEFPQPLRRIKKIWDQIFDETWDIITSESTRFKAAKTAGEGAAISSRSNCDDQYHKNDFDIAKQRSCDPIRQIPLANDTQVIGLASHCLLSVVVAAINNNPTENSTNTTPFLRVVRTADEDIKVLGDFPLVLSADAQIPAGTADADTIKKTHVVIKKISALRLSKCGYCCIAVHLVEATTTELVDQDPSSDVKPPAPTTRECVSVYAIRTATPDDNTALSEFSCELIAVINPMQTPESSISSIVLSPDSQYIAISFVGSAIVAVYNIHRDENNQDTEAGLHPLNLSSPAFQVDLESTRSPFTEGKFEPIVYFLVTPSTRTPTGATPNTYAFAVCFGLKLLKYILPKRTISNPTSPQLLTPVKSWEHLTKITASAQDITTQYVVVGCQDGTIVVWDVLRDVDYAFLSPLGNTDNKMDRSSTKSSGPVPSEVSDVIFCQPGYVVALSKPQHHLYFFDVRERGKPVLTRMVSSTPIPTSTSTRQTSSHPAVSMTSLAQSTTNSGIPVAVVNYSNGMGVFYDVRIAEAIGSVQTGDPLNPPSTDCSGATNIVGNQEILAAIGTNSTLSTEPHVNLYSWRKVLLVCFPFFTDMLDQRQEELTSSNVKQLFLSNDSAVGPSGPVPPSSITTQGTSVDTLETMFLRMAGELPSSPSPQASRTKKFIAGTSPLQFPIGQSSLLHDPSNLTLSSQITKDAFQRQTMSQSATSVMLEPLVPDNNAFFEQYHRENLDPLVIVDKEARLHRKRRELLKVMSAGGAW